jgi:hypothetical protein
MPVIEERTCAAEPLPADELLVNPEALIAEARRRQRKRWLVLTLVVATAAAAGLAAYLLASYSSTHSSATSGGGEIGKPATLQLHLRGFGTPLPTQLDQEPCPQGLTLIEIQPRGSVVGCVRTIRKWDAADYGVKRITQTVRETYHLNGGTLLTHETQTIYFARDQRHTTALFRGNVIGGSGRYAHARGTISGGGSGVNGHADWLVSLRLSYR